MLQGCHLVTDTDVAWQGITHCCRGWSGDALTQGRSLPVCTAATHTSGDRTDLHHQQDAAHVIAGRSQPCSVSHRLCAVSRAWLSRYSIPVQSDGVGLIRDGTLVAAARSMVSVLIWAAAGGLLSAAAEAATSACGLPYTSKESR